MQNRMALRFACAPAAIITWGAGGIMLQLQIDLRLLFALLGIAWVLSENRARGVSLRQAGASAFIVTLATAVITDKICRSVAHAFRPSSTMPWGAISAGLARAGHLVSCSGLSRRPATLTVRPEGARRRISILAFFQALPIVLVMKRADPRLVVLLAPSCPPGRGGGMAVDPGAHARPSAARSGLSTAANIFLGMVGSTIVHPGP